LSEERKVDRDAYRKVTTSELLRMAAKAIQGEDFLLSTLFDESAEMVFEQVKDRAVEEAKRAVGEEIRELRMRVTQLEENITKIVGILKAMSTTLEEMKRKTGEGGEEGEKNGSVKAEDIERLRSVVENLERKVDLMKGRPGRKRRRGRKKIRGEKGGAVGEEGEVAGERPAEG